MARDDWLVGGDRRAAAADRIYDIAADLVAQRGLAALDIDTLAARAHCSRATIYRHVGGKTEIRDAVVLRDAGRIVDTVRQAVAGMTGPDRVVTAITVALEQIRSDPLGQLMVSHPNMLGRTDLPASPVITGLAAELAGIDDDDPRAAQWIVHLVLSLVHQPIGDSRTEREILERFVAPAFEPRGG
jgi:AcrR family transcriptional regulator